MTSAPEFHHREVASWARYCARCHRLIPALGTSVCIGDERYHEDCAKPPRTSVRTELRNVVIRWNERHNLNIGGVLIQELADELRRVTNALDQS
jgi:hypothetical protein